MTRSHLARVKEVDEHYHLNCYGPRFFPDILIQKARGVYLTDTSGKRYIDCVAGISAVSVGHNNPEIRRRVAEYEKSNGVDHVSNFFYTKAQADYLEALVGVVPIDDARIFLGNSGAEVTNGAIKLAAKNKGHWLGYMSSTFHGRYGAALAATGQRKYLKGFEKTLPMNTVMMKFNDVAGLEAITDDMYAVILEVIEAEGGVVPATKEFIDALRQKCRNTGTLLIVDEVQSGFGRTGKMFACQHYDLFPDAVCMAKGIANGYPFGAIAFDPHFAGMVKPGEHASTYGGNPGGCIRAKAVLDIIEEKGLVQNAADMEELFYSMKFKRLRHVKDARGKGLLLGVEIDNPDNRKKVIEGCKNDGVLLCGCGDSVVRIVPPLTITEEQFWKAMEVLRNNIKRL